MNEQMRIHIIATLDLYYNQLVNGQLKRVDQVYNNDGNEFSIKLYMVGKILRMDIEQHGRE